MRKISSREGKNAFIKGGQGRPPTMGSLEVGEGMRHMYPGVEWCLGQRMTIAKALTEVIPALHI